MRDCPSVKELELAAVKSHAESDVHRHLSSCDGCRRLVEEIRGNHDVLTQLRGMNRHRLGSALGDRRESGAGKADGLAGYEILDTVGCGGQGVVYRAVQGATKRTVALKMTHPGHTATPRQQRRFEREIELVAGLRHPNIVTLFDSGMTADGRHYFSMEFLDGVPLDDWVSTVLRSDVEHPATAPSLPPAPNSASHIQFILSLFVKVCAAVQYAHQRGIIHRDLKPSNILVDAAGEPHVLDFGLAKVAEANRMTAASRVTQPGVFMGTMDFAAPEQVQGDPDLIDTRTDVYALGMILFRILTNETPYSTQGPLLQVARTIIETDPIAPSRVNPALDDELDAVALKALAKEKERRYPSAGALAEDLERYLTGLPISARRDSTWYVVKKAMRRHRRLTVGVVTSLFLLTGVAVAMTVLAQRLAWERDRADQTAQNLKATLHAQQIAAGRESGLAGNVPAAEDLLWGAFLQAGADDAQSQPDPSTIERRQRQSYWALRELYSRHPCATTWIAHKTRTSSLHFQPLDGTLISVGLGSDIRFWQVPGGRLLRELDISPFTVSSAALSRDGEFLAIGQSDGEIRLWNHEAGTWLGQFPGTSELMACLAFDYTGSRLASGAAAGTILIWDMATRSVERTIQSPPFLREICFSPDGAALVSGHAKDGARLWQVATGELVASVTDDWYVAWTIQFDRNGRYVLAAGDSPMHWWDLRTGQLDVVNSALRGPIVSLRFSPSGMRVATGGYDQTVRLWTLEEQRLNETASLAGHRAILHALAFSADERWVATGSKDGVVKLWDANPGGHRESIGDVDFSVHCVRFSPDGRMLTASGGDRRKVSQVRVWDLISGEVFAFQGTHGPVASFSTFISTTPGDNLIATTGYDGTIKLLDPDLESVLATFRTDSEELSSLAISPDGHFLAAASGDSVPVGRIEIWDVAARARIVTFEAHRDRVPQVWFSPDGTTVVSSGVDGRIVATSVDNHESHELCSGGPHIYALTVSPDGQSIYSGNAEGLIQVWDLNGSVRRQQWTAHFYKIYALAMHPNGRLLASAGVDGFVRLWDPADGHLLATLTGHSAGVYSLSFDPQGRWLASGGSDGNLFLWDLSYYDRHIAGNLDYQISRLPADAQDHGRVQELRGWAAGVLASDYSEGVSTSR